MDAQQDLLLNIKANVEDATRAIANLKGEFGGLEGALSALTSPVAAITVGIGALVTLAVSASEAFLNDAKAARELAFQTGLTTEQADALAKAMTISGGSSEYLHTAMMRLSLEIETGGKKLAELGITLRDNEGTLKTQGALFLETIDRLASMSNAQERNAAMVRLFGRGASEMIPIIEQWNSGLRDTYTNLSKTSSMTKEATEAAQAHERAINTVRTAYRGLADILGALAVGAFDKITNFLRDSVDMYGAEGEAVKKLGKEQEDLGKQIVAAAQSQNTANKELIKDQTGLNKELELLGIERLRAENRDFDASIKQVDIWAKEERAKFLQLYGFQEGDDVAHWAKTNANAAKAAAALDEIQRVAFEKRQQIISKSDDEYLQSQVDTANKAQIAWGRSLAKELQQNKEINDAKIKDDQQTAQVEMDTLAFIASSALNSNRELYMIARAAAVGHAIMSTYEAADNAMAEIPYPFNLAAAALVTAAGLANVASILSAPKPLAEGGIVTAPTFAMIGEAGPEAVIPLNKAGGMGGINITIYVGRQNDRTLARDVGNALMQRLRPLRAI